MAITPKPTRDTAPALFRPGDASSSGREHTPGAEARELMHADRCAQRFFGRRLDLDLYFSPA